MQSTDGQPIQPLELVRWCQRTLPDDTQAFEALVAQYKQRVWRLAYRLMGNRHDAEDQAQEVFLKIYRGIRSMDDGAALEAWIDRITRNTCLDALAKQKSRPQTEPLAGGYEQDTPVQYADTRLPTPEQAVLQQELRQCLETALSQLEVTGRAALVLRDINDQPYSEIAELLGIGLSAVKMRIHRARIAFQQLLATVCPGVWTQSSHNDDSTLAG